LGILGVVLIAVGAFLAVRIGLEYSSWLAALPGLGLVVLGSYLRYVSQHTVRSRG
jgi:hypothetical protein